MRLNKFTKPKIKARRNGVELNFKNKINNIPPISAPSPSRAYILPPVFSSLYKNPASTNLAPSRKPTVKEEKRDIKKNLGRENI